MDTRYSPTQNAPYKFIYTYVHTYIDARICAYKAKELDRAHYER